MLAAFFNFRASPASASAFRRRSNPRARGRGSSARILIWLSSTWQCTRAVRIRQGPAQFCREWQTTRSADCRRFGYKRVRAGSTVFNKSTDGSCVYMVISGMVRLLDVKSRSTRTVRSPREPRPPNGHHARNDLRDERADPAPRGAQSGDGQRRQARPRTIQIVRGRQHRGLGCAAAGRGFRLRADRGTDKDTEVPAEQRRPSCEACRSLPGGTPSDCTSSRPRSKSFTSTAA